MDNTGAYLSYAELISELYFGNSPDISVVEEILVLSNKVVDAGGDIYEVDKDTAQLGDVIVQLGKGLEVIEVLDTPDRIRVSATGTENFLMNGNVKLLRSEVIPKYRGEEIIANAMEFIDEQTGQFFNKRGGTYEIEGNNTPTMFFPVPIINIEKLLINGTNIELVEGAENDFVAFKGRQRPRDDRRNPKIKLNMGTAGHNIFSGTYSTGIFAKGTLTKIVGDFGFLNPDGSTPRQIKHATMLLAARDINKAAATTASPTSAGAGPLKRVRVDLHEKEFFEDKSATSKGSVSSGIPVVDQIIAKFKAPILIGGSTPMLTLEDSATTSTYYSR